MNVSGSWQGQLYRQRLWHNVLYRYQQVRLQRGNYNRRTKEQFYNSHKFSQLLFIILTLDEKYQALHFRFETLLFSVVIFIISVLFYHHVTFLATLYLLKLPNPRAFSMWVCVGLNTTKCLLLQCNNSRNAGSQPCSCSEFDLCFCWSRHIALACISICVYLKSSPW